MARTSFAAGTRSAETSAASATKSAAGTTRRASKRTSRTAMTTTPQSPTVRCPRRFDLRGHGRLLRELLLFYDECVHGKASDWSCLWNGEGLAVRQRVRRWICDAARGLPRLRQHVTCNQRGQHQSDRKRPGPYPLFHVLLLKKKTQLTPRVRRNSIGVHRFVRVCFVLLLEPSLRCSPCSSAWLDHTFYQLPSVCRIRS
jgi:hypothetical protein